MIKIKKINPAYLKNARHSKLKRHTNSQEYQETNKKDEDEEKIAKFIQKMNAISELAENPFNKYEPYDSVGFDPNCKAYKMLIDSKFGN